jgi:hypothetical protein
MQNNSVTMYAIQTRRINYTSTRLSIPRHFPEDPEHKFRSTERPT